MTEKQLEKMRQYFNKEMSAGEAKHFEDNLASDEALSAAYTVYSNLESKMPLYGENSLKEEALKKSIEHLNNVYFDSRSAGSIPVTGTGNYGAKTTLPLMQATRKYAFSKWALVAASVAGIIILSVSLYLWQQKKDKQPVANKATTGSLPPYTPPPAQKQVSANVTIETKAKVLYKLNFKPDNVPANTEGPLLEAFESYQQGDYRQAAAFFENPAPAEDTRGEQDDTLLQPFYAAYYKGLCYMATGWFLKAQASLQNAVEQSPAKTLKAKAQWYLALVYLNTGDIPGSQTLLKQVALSGAALYKAKAANLLNGLQDK